MAEVRVALGCGKDPIPGFIGLDIEDFKWNKKWDATKDKIPLDDNSVDFVQMHNFLEHIERRYWIPMFNEIWRVLKPSGMVEIITPDAGKSIELAMQDPTHVAFVVKGTFSAYFTGARPRNADYGLKKWFIIQCRNYDEKEPRDMFVQMRPNKDKK